MGTINIRAWDFLFKRANVLFVAWKKQKQKQGYFLFFSVFSISRLFCESVCRHSLLRFAAVPTTTTTTTVGDIFRYTYIFPLSLFKSTRKRVLFIVVIMCLSLILKKEGIMRVHSPKRNKKSRLIEVAKRGVFPNLEKGLSFFLFLLYIGNRIGFFGFFFQSLR